MEEALNRAKANNPDFLQQQQNILEAERDVNKTRVESRFNASLNASVGFNQVAEKVQGCLSGNRYNQDLVELSVYPFPLD